MFNLSFDPTILRNLLDERTRAELAEHLPQAGMPTIADNEYNRRLGMSKYIDHLAVDVIAPMAKDLFKDATLKMTYSLYCRYDTPQSHLPKHRDDNACTYTIDYCVSARTPWPIWIEDREYPLAPNEAVAFLGEDQTHWREPFPDPEHNVVEMIFFHFAPQNHWYFTHGPNHVRVIAARMEALARAHGMDPVDVYKIPDYRSHVFHPETSKAK